MFLDTLNIGEHWPVLSVPINTFTWALRDLHHDCWSYLTPIFYLRLFVPLAFVTPWAWYGQDTDSPPGATILPPPSKVSPSPWQNHVIPLKELFLDDGRKKLCQCKLLFCSFNLQFFLLFLGSLFYKTILKMKADKQESWALWCLFSKFMVTSVYVSTSLQPFPQILGQNKMWTRLPSPFIGINIISPVLSRGSNTKHTHLTGEKSLSTGLSLKM